jgi:adenine-specific DNA-methyltransferase
VPFFAHQKSTVPFTAEILLCAPYPSFLLHSCSEAYLVNYRARDGRGIAGDKQADWLLPAFTEMYRVLKPHSFCVSFYGWHKADMFLAAWRMAGLRPVGHFVWTKGYASKRGFTEARHECAYLLAKGHPRAPARALPDVLPWRYTGNKLHPTQKPVMALQPLIAAYSQAGGVVLDPFAGSASTAIAARLLGRSFVAIEKDAMYHRIASERLAEAS